MIHKFEVQVQEFEMQDVVDAYTALEDFMPGMAEPIHQTDQPGHYLTGKDLDIVTFLLGQVMVQAERKGVKFTFKPKEV